MPLKHQKPKKKTKGKIDPHKYVLQGSPYNVYKNPNKNHKKGENRPSVPPYNAYKNQQKKNKKPSK